MMKILQFVCIRRITVGLVLVGLGLRLWQYSGNSSLWLDELRLAQNIVTRSLVELLNEPLDFGQVAPPGFLVVEKLATLGFGPSEMVLRLFPLLGGLLAMVLFWRIAQIVLSEVESMIAVALFATAMPFIIFSSQVKQYSTDVLVALWLIWLTLETPAKTMSGSQALRLGIGGAIGAIFSHPAVFVLGGIGTVLAWLDGPQQWSSNNHRVPPLFIVIALWGAASAAAIVVALSSLTPEGQLYMQHFWSAGFPPAALSELSKTPWPWSPLKALLDGHGLVTLGYRVPQVFLLLLVFGCGHLGRTNVRNLGLLLAPAAFTLAAATLRQYPFSDRLILFLVPNFLILVAAGVGWLRQWIERFSRPIAYAAVIFLLGAGIAPIFREPPIYRTEDVKPLLAYLQSQIRGDDALYVHYGAWQAVRYYGPHYGWTGAVYLEGDCHRGNPRGDLEEIDAFRGRRRVWVLMVHTPRYYRARENLVAYLDTIGVRHQHFKVESHYPRRKVGPAELFLYDLSDSSRLSRATAKTFLVQGPTAVAPHLPCGIGEGPKFSSPLRSHSP